MYRSRATVEHLIHSLKRVTGLEPLRIWKEDSIGDAILLALLAENNHRNGRIRDGNEEGDQGRKGRRYGRECHHPIESMVWSLGHSTDTRSIEKGKAKKAHSSN